MRSKRQKSILKAIQRNSLELQKSKSETYSIVMGTDIVNISTKFQEYRSKEEFLEDDNDLVFAELQYSNFKWLDQLATAVLKAGQDYRYSFFNSEYDFKNPGLCAFRVYDGDQNCIHVQVRRVPGHPSLFLLDYFEEDEKGNIEDVLICTVDIAKPKLAEVDIVNSKNLTKSECWKYAYRIGGLFRDIMIYMRIWEYGCSKHCEVKPLFSFNCKSALA